jgi:molybdate transport system substrate-binding protein
VKKLGSALVATLLVVCFAGVSAPAGAGGSNPVSGDVTVFAASSLTEAFTKMGTQFEKKYPDATATFNFLASSELATQIQQGAPADVFASADEANMQKVVDSGDVTATPKVFVRNKLQIAVETGNPQDIKTLADAAQPDIVLVLCADAVPCGRYANEAFVKAGVTPSPTSKGENAKALVTTVSTGEADAGVVYVTDVKAAKGSVAGVRIPDSVNVIAAYPIAVTAESGNASGAKAWVQYVLSKKGQKTLREFGFLAP